MTLPVFVAPAAAHAYPGALLTLDGAEGHHAVRVRRVRVGEQIDIVDGRGTRATCTVTVVAKDSLEARAESVATEPAGTRITVVQALAKGGRDEQAVETCTEYGAAAFIPWEADRSVVHWKGEKRAKGRARWEVTALAAAKQSRRAWIPEVRGALNTRDLVAFLSAEQPNAAGHADVTANTVPRVATRGGVVLICHETATVTLPTLLTEHRAVAARIREAGATVVVGPEGGISPAELEALGAAGGMPVLLTRNVLRSGSAAPFAIATIQALTDTMGSDD
ncbi:16S rRNA (uracil(1498)-N(3))-methyltransferase [Neoactinobaculum massilliense]|uniref:16S rRNA (uracil(1498)-N(3))-methyltransferase n=1 Tax=Neoactinobaculum massilliense TaxID=2364794 RepID=UPI000F52303D|nr:16S rRNA (uracil(1498)-N(3))-methyltransferase [Neoactinobaculum massilliense]